MDFRYTPEEQCFRIEVRKFIAEEIPEELKAQTGEGANEYIPLVRATLKKMAARGWLGAAFPKEYGGMGKATLVPMTEYILIDELYGGACGVIALQLTYLITVIGNTILSVGSEETKKKFLPQILSADTRLAISYSEPDAGSDIANIKTKYVEDGDEYVLNGSKRFNTQADTSDYLWTLCRQPGTVRHKGMTLMMVPTRSKGITIVPVKMRHGVTTCEVFLDDVRVPKENLVGQPGKAWMHLMEALARERTTMINFKHKSEPFEKFLHWVRSAEIDGERLAADPVLRQSLANAQLMISGGKMLQLIAGSRAMNKGYIPTMEGAASKVVRCLISWENAALSVDTMRLYGLLTDEHPGAPLDGYWADEYAGAGHEMSGAGGLDLNRQIIAQQGLGLPKQKFV